MSNKPKHCDSTIIEEWISISSSLQHFVYRMVEDGNDKGYVLYVKLLGEADDRFKLIGRNHTAAIRVAESLLSLERVKFISDVKKVAVR